MHIYSNQELEKIIIDESVVKGMSWKGEHWQDLILDIDWAGQEDLAQEIDFLKCNASLFFEFVTDLEFNFKSKKGTIGGLEITSFTFDLIGKIWAIQFTFDFYPVGYIKFNCNNFKFIVDTNPD